MEFLYSWFKSDSSGRVLLTSAGDAREDPEADHDDGAHPDPLARNVKQGGPVNEAADKDQIPDDVDAEGQG